MTYRLASTIDLKAQLASIVEEQAGRALAQLDEPGGDGVGATVHDVRKRCKKLRGVARLVRPSLGSRYSEANELWRDAGRALADLRDARAMASTAADLLAITEESALEPLVAALESRAEAQEEDEARVAARFAHAADLIRTGCKVFTGADITDDFKPLRKGIAKTYGRGRSQCVESISSSQVETLHTWRKRVKYTWYQMRLIRPAAPSVLRPLAGRLHDLSDALGSDHDLAILMHELHHRRELAGDALEPADLNDVVASLRGDLQDQARRLGVRLFVESADAFSSRIGGYWEAWAQHGIERPAGDLAAVDR